MIDDLLKYNKEFVANNNYEKYITNKYPDKKLAIVACMDTRLTELLPASLGLKNGDAKIIKNAGGVITHPFGSVMRSLLVAIYELGVKEIITFSSKFSSSYINENKLARLNKVSVEAAKQCGRAIAPKVTYADTLEKALNACAHVKNKLFACEFATKNEVDFGSLSGDTAIVIGSEGGFSIEENDLALSLGFKTVFLGKRILRAETACISLTAIVMHSLKELE